jgi:hypothetical protein
MKRGHAGQRTGFTCRPLSLGSRSGSPLDVARSVREAGGGAWLPLSCKAVASFGGLSAVGGRLGDCRVRCEDRWTYVRALRPSAKVARCCRRRRCRRDRDALRVLATRCFDLQGRTVPGRTPNLLLPGRARTAFCSMRRTASVWNLLEHDHRRMHTDIPIRRRVQLQGLCATMGMGCRGTGQMRPSPGVESTPVLSWVSVIKQRVGVHSHAGPHVHRRGRKHRPECHGSDTLAEAPRVLDRSNLDSDGLGDRGSASASWRIAIAHLARADSLLGSMSGAGRSAGGQGSASGCPSLRTGTGVRSPFDVQRTSPNR